MVVCYFYFFFFRNRTSPILCFGLHRVVDVSVCVCVCVFFLVGATMLSSPAPTRPNANNPQPKHTKHIPIHKYINININKQVLRFSCLLFLLPTGWCAFLQLLETAEKAISDADARNRLLDGIKDSTVDFLLEYLPHIEVQALFLGLLPFSLTPTSIDRVPIVLQSMVWTFVPVWRHECLSLSRVEVSGVD